MSTTPTLTALQVMQDAPVIPVIVLNDVAHAVPMARALVAGCPTGGCVLDPFGGSGTTAVVAQRHGRDAVLIDRMHQGRGIESLLR